jgi:uncharacterized protein (DUF2235 family)
MGGKEERVKGEGNREEKGGNAGRRPRQLKFSMGSKQGPGQKNDITENPHEKSSYIPSAR